MHKIKGNIFAFLGTSIFALNFISMKVLVDLIPAKSIIFLRFAGASIFLFMLLKIQQKKIVISSKKDMLQFVLTGFLGMSLYYLFFTYALKYISPSLTSLLCALIPILTLFTDTVVNKRKAKLSTLIFFAFSVFGVYLVIDVNIEGGRLFTTAKGVLLMLCALAAWISYTIKTEYLLENYDTMLMLAYQCAAGAVITLFISYDELLQLPQIINYSNFRVIGLNIIFVSVFASALGYYFYNLGIRYLGVTISSAYMNTMPAITAAAAYFILGAEMTEKKIAGIFIVTAVTFAAAFKKKLAAEINKLLD